MTYDLDDVDMLDLSDPTGPRRIMHLVFDPNHPGLCLTLSCGHVFDGPHPLLEIGPELLQPGEIVIFCFKCAGTKAE
jgi:hypothetical protein